MLCAFKNVYLGLMKIFKDIKEVKEKFPWPVVTIGNFDGTHLGHQELFSEVVSRACRRDGTSVVITFEPHPLKVLHPEGIRLIASLEQKIECIRTAGVDVLLVLPFSKEFARTKAVDFVADILVATLGIKELVIGYDYAFGRGREGDFSFLSACGDSYGFTVDRLEAIHRNGMLVSSSKIRELISQGRMRAVAKLLGRLYQIRGKVVKGRQVGGLELGFPTANLRITEDDLCPKRGVYVTQVLYGGRVYGAVSNIGRNPTFGEHRLVAETHIFDFDKDIYGEEIKINFIRYLRGEHKFAGASELVAQIKRDVVSAERILSKMDKNLSSEC